MYFISFLCSPPCDQFQRSCELLWVIMLPPVRWSELRKFRFDFLLRSSYFSVIRVNWSNCFDGWWCEGRAGKLKQTVLLKWLFIGIRMRSISTGMIFSISNLFIICCIPTFSIKYVHSILLLWGQKDHWDQKYNWVKAIVPVWDRLLQAFVGWKTFG